MPRTSLRPKVESFNFRVDPELKAAFTAATAQEDKPAGQVLRDFMRAYVEQQREHGFAAEARRLTRRSVRPVGRCSGRLTAMNCQAPMFAGSSCTHTTSVAFG